jgi:hypothetical protein
MPSRYCLITAPVLLKRSASQVAITEPNFRRYRMSRASRSCRMIWRGPVVIPSARLLASCSRNKICHSALAGLC